MSPCLASATGALAFLPKNGPHYFFILSKVYIEVKEVSFGGAQEAPVTGDVTWSLFWSLFCHSPPIPLSSSATVRT